MRPLASFIEPQGYTIQRLNAQLIETFVARGELPSEAEARQRRRAQAEARQRGRENLPQSPFAPVAIPLPPLLPDALRRQEPEPAAPQPPAQPVPPARPPQRPAALRPAGVLVWRKTLPQTDALQVNEGSHHVGGVRLSSATTRWWRESGDRDGLTVKHVFGGDEGNAVGRKITVVSCHHDGPSVYLREKNRAAIRVVHDGGVAFHERQHGVGSGFRDRHAAGNAAQGGKGAGVVAKMVGHFRNHCGAGDPGWRQGTNRLDGPTMMLIG